MPYTNEHQNSIFTSINLCLLSLEKRILAVISITTPESQHSHLFCSSYLLNEYLGMDVTWCTCSGSRQMQAPLQHCFSPLLHKSPYLIDSQMPLSEKMRKSLWLKHFSRPHLTGRRGWKL